AIVLDYLDYDGAQQQIRADGLLSRCIQHEMDHLLGRLFVDHLSAVKRSMILRKLEKVRRQKVND
ncbi:MAG: peptide deformylase, partial [Alphaproteobacteria bacterium]|nr:peptide deformylase [Alphaproteobacteria bacterium]